MSRPTAVITGASRGIGAAVARALAPDFHLVLIGRDADRLGKVAHGCPQAQIVQLDVTDHQTVGQHPDILALSRVDVVVHCAGTVELGSIADTTVEQWQRTWDVNVLAVVGLTRVLLPALRAAGGHVVAINSGAGRHAKAQWGSYGASKFALRAFSDTLRSEEPTLRVTSIYPGRVATDMQRSVVEFEGRSYNSADFLRPESIADSVRHAVLSTSDAVLTDIILRPATQ